MIRVLAAVAVLTLTALAGCASSGNAGGGAYTITAPDTPGGSYRFEATVDAENYTWDLGDRLTTKYGASIEHVYDFTNGQVVVVLTTKNGGETKDYSEKLTLGTGKNEKSTFILESQRNWTILGETTSFSATASTDPEGDPMRFSWSCNRVSDATRSKIHTHDGGGVPFASAPSGSVTSGLATRTLPAAEATYSGDLCEALGSGTPLGTNTDTITGSFAKGGIYDIFLIAADGAHPTTSGSYRIYVTPADERPAPLYNKTFTGTLQGGAGGALQGLCSTDLPTGAQSCDRAEASFVLPTHGLGGSVTFAYTSSPLNAATLLLQHGSGNNAKTVATLTGPGTATFDGANLNIEGTASFTAIVTLTNGAMVDWTVDLAIDLDLNPAKLY